MRGSGSESSAQGVQSEREREKSELLGVSPPGFLYRETSKCSQFPSISDEDVLISELCSISLHCTAVQGEVGRQTDRKGALPVHLEKVTEPKPILHHALCSRVTHTLLTATHAGIEEQHDTNKENRKKDDSDLIFVQKWIYNFQESFLVCVCQH